MKKISSVILVIPAIVALVGCQSAGPKKASVASSKVYTTGVKGQVVATTKNKAKNKMKKCFATKDLQGKVAWKAMVEIANSCTRSAQWNRLGVVAKKMTEDYVNSPWGPYFLSIVAESKGNTKRALWMVELALKKAPNVGMLHYQKGRLLWQTGEFNHSLQSVKQATNIDSKLVEGHLFLGKVYLRDRYYSKSESRFEKVLSIAGGSSEAHYGLAQVNYLTESYSDAGKQLELTIRYNPKNVDAYKLLGDVYENHTKDLEKALSTYKSGYRVTSKMKASRVNRSFFKSKVAEVKVLIDKETAKKAMTLSQYDKGKAKKEAP